MLLAESQVMFCLDTLEQVNVAVSIEGPLEFFLINGRVMFDKNDRDFENALETHGEVVKHLKNLVRIIEPPHVVKPPETIVNKHSGNTEFFTKVKILPDLGLVHSRTLIYVFVLRTSLTVV